MFLNVKHVWVKIFALLAIPTNIYMEDHVFHLVCQVHLYNLLILYLFAVTVTKTVRLALPLHQQVVQVVNKDSSYNQITLV